MKMVPSNTLGPQRTFNAESLRSMRRLVVDAEAIEMARPRLLRDGVEDVRAVPVIAVISASPAVITATLARCDQVYKQRAYTCA